MNVEKTHTNEKKNQQIGREKERDKKTCCCIFMKTHLSGAPHRYTYTSHRRALYSKMQTEHCCLWFLIRNVPVLCCQLYTCTSDSWLLVLPLYSAFAVSTVRLSIVSVVNIRNCACSKEQEEEVEEKESTMLPPFIKFVLLWKLNFICVDKIELN